MNPLFRSPRMQIAVGILAALLIVASTVIYVRSYLSNPTWLTSLDFGGYLYAGTAIAQGQDPYTYEPCPCNAFYGTTEMHDQVAYPPFFMELLLPLQILGSDGARLAWMVVSVASIIASFALLMRGFGYRLPWVWVALIIGIFGVSANGRITLYHGQVNPFLMLMLTLGLWLRTRQRPISAGVVLGIAIVIKPFLGVVALYFLWRRDWRVAFASILTSGILFVGSFIPLIFAHGLAVIQSWRDATSYYTSGDIASRPDNYSLTGILRRIFLENQFTVPWLNSPLLFQGLSIALVIIVVGLYVSSVPFGKALESGATPAPLQLLLEFGALLMLSMVYGPMTESDHTILLFPAFFGTFFMAYQRSQEHASNARIWQIAAGVAGLAVLVVLSPIIPQVGLPSSANWTPLAGLRILLTGQFIIWFLAAALLLVAALRTERYQLTSMKQNI